MCDPVSSCKLKIRSLIDDALKSLGLTDTAEYSVEYSAISAYGDFSSNVSFVYSRFADLSSYELSVRLAEKLSGNTLFDSVSVSQQGFLNFLVISDWYAQALSVAFNSGDRFGKSGSIKGDATIITIDGLQTNREEPFLFRNEAVAFALYHILEADGYSVIRQKADPAFSDYEGRTIICAPSKYWDSGKVPTELSAFSEHVVTSECIFHSSETVWDESLIILLNEAKPQTHICLKEHTQAKVKYGYAWVCSLLRSFDHNYRLSNGCNMILPTNPQERLLAKQLLMFPSVISKASNDLDPSAVLRYLSDVIYNFRLLRDEYGRSAGLTAAKSEQLFWYTSLVKQVLHNGLLLFSAEASEYL